MFMWGSLCYCDVNDVIYDADGARKGRYGYMQGPIWVHVRAIMGSGEWAVMGLKSQAVSAHVTKHFVTIFNKVCNNG